MLEKHNEVLIQLSEAAQELAVAQAKTRTISYWAFGLAGLGITLAILFGTLK
jgi:hypothetical protein